MVDTVLGRPYLPSGYSWTECPRWHDGRMFFSDLFNARVLAVAPGGPVGTYLDLSARVGLDGREVVVAGLGFLPDGRLLVNSMHERVTLVWDGSEARVYADLRALATGPINDMVVDEAGRAYVSQLGYELFDGAEPRDASIMAIEPDGTPRVVEEAGLMKGPNGMAITADGRTLLVAEPNASRITAFDRAPDGTLSGRRVFAELDDIPDGICADVEGAVWAGQPRGPGAVRVRDGGEVVARVSVPRDEGGSAIACVLGDDDRRTLYICCGFEVMDRVKSRQEGKGSIWTARVDVSGGDCRP